VSSAEDFQNVSHCSSKLYREIHTCIQTYICICIFINTFVYLYIYINKYGHMYISKYIFTYILQVSSAEDFQNASQIHTIDRAILTAPNTEEISEPLLSLQDGGTDVYTSLDEFMRVTIAKIVIVNPVDRILRDGPHLVPTLLNGPILRIPAFSNTSYFAAWLGPVYD
jgi:hypothetical protein